MTHDQWMTALAPVISAVVLGLAGILTVVLSGVSGRLKAYLDVRGQAQASAIVADASAALQAGMANSAGQIALKIQAGKLDVTNEAEIGAEAAAQATKLEAKLAGAVATAQPIAGALAEGILGKLGNLGAAVPPIVTAPVKAAS